MFVPSNYKISASLKPGTTFLKAFSVTKINTSCTAMDIEEHSFQRVTHMEIRFFAQDTKPAANVSEKIVKATIHTCKFECKIISSWHFPLTPFDDDGWLAGWLVLHLHIK
uniref:Uncharacterized protein n=1 Tax=Glossina pallidipes TaxID=7398 RepID=A0A1A9ZFP1_GLOPL